MGPDSLEVGEEKRAYLYDRTRQDEEGYDLFLKELAVSVTDVEFSDPADGPLQIVLHKVDPQGGKHALVFDADGNRLGAAPPEPQPQLDEPQSPSSEPDQPGGGSSSVNLEGARKLLEGLTPDRVNEMFR